MTDTHENIAIVVTPRDRFTTTATCLRNIFKNSSPPFEVMAVLGGAPKNIQEELQSEFGDRVNLIFKPDFLNSAQARNIALEVMDTRLAVFLDTDVYVRPGWLDPLIRCQKEHNAVMVSPNILDKRGRIHTAGNDFYVHHENGLDYGAMELRFQGQKVGSQTNLVSQPTDFGEVHCQLFEAEFARKHKVYDEGLREHHEMDSGLTVKQHQGTMMFEPESQVYLYYPKMIDRTEDIPLYKWKWDDQAMQDSRDYFLKKWNIHVNYKNHFGFYLYNIVWARLGFFSKRFNTNLAIQIDRLFFPIFSYLRKVL